MINQPLVSTGLIINITFAMYKRKIWLYLPGLVTKNISKLQSQISWPYKQSQTAWAMSYFGF